MTVKANFFAFKGASGASITQTITLDPDKVCRESQIYQLKPDDKLLDYHKAINEAAFDIALKNPTLLCSKLELQKQARTKVHEDGFAYKKKNSRSKEFGSASGSEPKQERTSNVTINIQWKFVPSFCIYNIFIDINLIFRYDLKAMRRW